MKPINSTTIQKYYRALSALFNWSINEGTLETNLLVRIKVPRAEKKVVKALDSAGVNQLVSSLPNTFDGVRNKATILILVDCGLRLGELLNIKMSDINMEQQLMRVDGKTGERVVRYGKTTAKVTKTPVDDAYKKLNQRMTTLEKLVEELKAQMPKARKVREYTDEQRKAIRVRLLAGQEAAKKKRENENMAKFER